MPKTYKEGDVLQNDKGQKIVLRNNQWVPAPPQTPQMMPGSMQTKPGGPILNAFQQQHPIRAIPSTILQSFGIDPEKVESAKSTVDALKSGAGQTTDVMGEQMFESLAKAGPLAPAHLFAKGIDATATAIEEGSKKAYDSYRTGDRYGLYQGLTQVASSLGQLALMRAGEPAAKKTLEVEGRIVRKGAQAPLGIGRVAEQFASQKHGAEVATNQQENAVAISSARQASEEATRQAAEKNHEITTKNIQDVSRARQTSEEAVRKIEEANAQTAADYEKQKLLMEAQYKRDMQKFERARSAQALTSQEKGSRPSATSEAAGATKQRLQAWSDKVGEIAGKTRDNLKTAFNKRYDAFRGTLGADPQVDWTPVQQAVKNAEDNILQGSPDSLALFRNIMKESPQLDDASVFKTTQATEATQNMKEILQKANPNMRKQILANLAAQGISEADIARTAMPGQEPIEMLPGQNIKLAHKDAWGYAQELNAKLRGSQLPQDVYRALKSVKEAIDTELQTFADSKNAGAAWKQIQFDYSEYAQRFLDKDSPAYRLMNATNPEDRLSIIAGKEGQNLIDVLHKYRGFGGDTEIAGKVRALRAAGAKIVDELVEPTRKTPPAPPELQPLPTQSSYPAVRTSEPFPTESAYPAVQPTTPFSPEEWKKKQLRSFQENMATRQTQNKWQLASLPFYRAISALYSNPAFVKLILGIK
jgi:hypothetical protein